MADDPYAQYLTPPSSAPAPSGGGDPYAKYLSPPGGPSSGASSSAPSSSSGLGTWLTSPTFANESYAREAKDIGLAGADYLGFGQLKRIVPTSVGDAIQQAHQNLGLADYGVGAGTYFIPGVGEAAMLGRGAKLLGASAKWAPTVEGAIAGGVSGFDPNAPVSSTLEGAAGGAGIGWGAGKISKGVGVLADTAANTRLGQAAMDAAGGTGVGQAILRATGASMGGTAADAVAQTAAKSDNAFATLRQTQVQPAHADNAFDNVLSNLSPSQETGISDNMQSKIDSIRGKINQQGVLGNQVSGDDLHSWARQVQDAATTKIDGGVANDIATQLRGAVGAQGGAGAWDAANAAFKQAKMAENLQGWQTDLAQRGVSPGDEPVTQQKYYNPTTEQPQIDQLNQLYKAGAQHVGGLSYLAGRAGGELAEGAAAAGLGGIPTRLVGLGGHLLKYPVQGVQNAYKRANLANELRKTYQPLTGQAVGNVAPNVGELIRSLAVTQGSQYGY